MSTYSDVKSNKELQFQIIKKFYPEANLKKKFRIRSKDEDINPSASMKEHNGVYFVTDFGLSGAMDCFEIVKKEKNVDFKEAVEFIEQNFMLKERSPEYSKPQKNSTELNDKIVKWFESRGISQFTLTRAHVGCGVDYLSQVKKKVQTIHFNYYLDGELVNRKYRDGAKHFQLEGGAKLIPYQIDFTKESSVLYITEGEIDVLTLNELGIWNVISPPNGAQLKNNNLQWLDNVVDRLEGKTKIVLCLDNDPAGRSLESELIRRFGPEYCFKVDLGEYKDINEYLNVNGREEALKAIQNPTEIPITGIVKAETIRSQIYDLYKNGITPGYKAGYPILDQKVTWETTRFYVVTGIPSHGKSEGIDEITTRLNLLNGWKIGYFTPENYPLSIHFRGIAQRLIGQKFDKKHMTIMQMDHAYNYIKDNFFWVFPEDEAFTFENILEKFRALIFKYGIKVCVLDPWNTIESSHDALINETKFLESALDKIRVFARKYDVLFIVIAHPTKISKREDGEYHVPNLYSISGSANWFNKADIGMTVYRDTNDLTTVYIQKVKFRHLGERGFSMFRFNINNGRFTEVSTPNESPSWDNSNWLAKEETQTSLNDADVDFEKGEEEPPF